MWVLEDKYGFCRSEEPVESVTETPVDKPAVPRVRSNPFGSARPREEVLKEKTTAQTSPPLTEVGEGNQEEPGQAVKVELDAPENSQSNVPEGSDKVSVAEDGPEPVDEQPEAVNAEQSR